MTDHGYEFQKAKREFFEQSRDNPMVSSYIRGWIQQEMNRDSSYWRNPPGFDVGHDADHINDPAHLRWENADMNRSRGGSYGR